MIKVQHLLNPFEQTKTKNEKNIKYESYPYLGYRLKPNQSNDSVYINRHGFRSPEINNSFDSILLLGNSTLFGSGLNDNQTINYYLSSYFKNVNIINMGMSGYTIKEELLLLMEVLPTIKNIKTVVFIDGFTDIYFSFINKKVGCSPYFFDREHSKSCNVSLIEKIKCKFKKSKKINEFYELPSKEEIYENYMVYTNYIISILKEKNIDFRFFIQPSLYYVIQEHSLQLSDNLHNKLNIFKNKHQNFIKYFCDVYSLFENIDQYNKYYFFGDLFKKNLSDYYTDTTHYTAKGNQIIAEEIKNIILGANNVK